MISRPETVRFSILCLVDRKEERQVSAALYVTSLLEERHKEPAPTATVMSLRATVPLTESVRQGVVVPIPTL